jgi:hypothetical protein
VTQKIAKIELETIPNSDKFRIMGFNPWTGRLRVKIKSKAQKGEANKELLLEFQKIFKNEAQILSGEKSRKKTILLKNISEKEAKETLTKKSKS